MYKRQGLLRGVGLYLAVSLIIDAIADAFTDAGSLAQFLYRVLPVWALTWDGVITRIVNNIIGLWQIGINAIIDAINTGISALATEVEVPGIGNINPLTGVIGDFSIGRQDFSNLLRPEPRAPSNLGELQGGGETGESGSYTVISPTINVDPGPYDQAAIDKIVAAIFAAGEQGIVLPTGAQ